MTIGSGIAILGIWLVVAAALWLAPGIGVIIAFFAWLATGAIAARGDDA